MSGTTSTETQSQPWLVTQPPASSSGGSGAVILGAAMIAVGEIIEPDKTNVEIAEVSDEHEPDPEQELKLDFGDLPPLG